MLERDPNSEVLKIWREKLAYLQKQEAITADPAQKFALRHQIEEAKAKIAELTQAHQKPSDGAGHSNADAGPVETGKPASADGTSNLKQLSEQDVQRVATQKMREVGNTTTLAVKLKLRSDGFFATQQQVSEAMKLLAAAQGWMSTISHDHLVYSLPPEQKPETDTRQLREMEGNKKRLVILVHGIRTRAEWQGRLRFLFEAAGETLVEPLGYGYFDVLRFLFPFWTRRCPVKEVLRKVRDAISQHRDEHREIIFVAHSFGTFILSKILRENPDIRADRMLLCGSVIKRTYLWDTLPNRPKVVINEAGSRDIWPILAKSITWGYGSTGTFGFQTPGVRDRYHNLAHSDYFKGDFAERFWVPWIRYGQLIPTPFETGPVPPTPLWKNLFEVFPLKWVGLLFLALILVSYLTHPAWHLPGFLNDLKRKDPIQAEVRASGPGKIILSVTREEQQQETQKVVSPTKRVDSSNDDHDLDVSADPVPAGWTVVPGSVHVPITWAQGDKNHDWWLDNIRESQLPSVHVRTEHHGLGTSGKIEFHFEYQITRWITVETNVDREIELTWGQSKVEPVVLGKWRIRYTPPGGSVQEIIGPYKMRFLEIKLESANVVLSAPPI